MGGYVKQQLRLGVILAEDGEGAVVRRPRLGGDALGHLLLHHDGNGLEAVRFQQGCEDGGGDVIGQVGAGHGPQTGQLLPDQGGNIQLQHIVPHQLHIGAILQCDIQDGL